MFRRLFKRMRARRMSLTAKIMALITIAVVASLALAGTLIFDSLRTRTFEDATDSLLQVASTAAVSFDPEKLAAIRGPADRTKPAYRQAKDALAKIWRQNHYDEEDRWGRISLVRLKTETLELTYVVSLQDDRHIGQKAPASSQVYAAALKNDAVAMDPEDALDGWLRVWAPLKLRHGVPDNGERLMVCVETNLTRLDRQQLRIVGVMLLAAMAGLAMALAGGWMLTHQITKPLRAFIDVMRLMQSTGDFDIRIDLHPEDKDMSVVEETFSSLIARVRESRRKEEGSYWSTMQALVAALDVRDNETAGHSIRVTRYAMAIAERMRVGEAVLDQVRQGALLHDIGKIGVPDAVLRKTGKLSEDEWDAMKKHPAIGRQFLEEIEFLKPATAVVYCHHERWDGQGYPNGVAGENIPLAARIFAVADALDTITSERYYKHAASFHEARLEIERSAGSHFDPSVVKAFLTLPEKAFLRIRLDTNAAVMSLDRARTKQV